MVVSQEVPTLERYRRREEMKLDDQDGPLVSCHRFFTEIGEVFFSLPSAAKSASSRLFQWYEVCQMSTFLFMSTYGLLFVVAAAHGIEQHTTQLPPDDVKNIFKIIYSGIYMYNCTVILIRIIISLLYIVLFGHKAFRYFTLGFAASIFVFPLASMAYLFGYCGSASNNWHIGPLGICNSLSAIEVVSGIVNLIVDLIVVWIPMPVVWRLQMPTRNKTKVANSPV